MKIIISLFCFISNTKWFFPLHLYLCSFCSFTYSFVKYCFVILSLCLFVSLSLSLSLTFSVFRPDLQHFFGIFISFFVPQIWNLNRWRKKNLLSEALTDDWWSENFLSQLLQISFVCLIKNKRKYKFQIF